MVLNAILSLNTAGFTTPLGRAIEGVRFLTNTLGTVAANVGKAFDAGGALSDLSAQLSEPVGDLMVLKQAFQDTGVGAESLGQTVALMRKSLGGISEDGQPTAKVFKQLGLDMEALKGMSAKDQLDAVGGAIRGLASPAEQTAAAMAVFGRSGNAMLTFLKDEKAIGAAAASLGELPALMQRNANAFDAVSDRIGRIKGKSAGLWAGIAEGLLPLADAVTGLLDGIDLTGIGQRVGAFLGTTVELFRNAPLGQLLRDGIVIYIAEWYNLVATSFVKLGGVLWKALSTPLSYLSAAFGKVIQEIMELIGRIPKLGKALGLDGFKADSFSEIQKGLKETYAGIGDDALGAGKVTVIDVSAEKARMASVWTDAANAYQAKLGSIQDAANATAAPGTGELAAIKETKAAKEGSAPTVAADQLARIGGFVGGGMPQRRLETLSERTAKATETMVQLLRTTGRTGAKWGLA